MLKTIKQTISDLPCISFEQYYAEYVMDVQDKCINSEVKHMVQSNILNPELINRIIGAELERFVL